MGITIVVFVAIAFGVVTFGHAFMAANMITHGARDEVRVAATWPQRGPCLGATMVDYGTSPASGAPGEGIEHDSPWTHKRDGERPDRGDNGHLPVRMMD